MGIDITVKIGGEAGQGIQTVGQLLALTCQRSGLYVFAINDFESRIRGGHSFFQIRISDTQVRAPNQQVNLLICLDHKTLDIHRDEVAVDGLIMLATKDAGAADGVLSIPIFDLARKAGSAITANTVAAGACLALLGAPFDLFSDIITRQFAGKSSEAITQNVTAAQLGYDSVRAIPFNSGLDWKEKKPNGKLLEGSLAVALGALAGDLRFAAFYPMSPATSIMGHLASYADKFPLVVEQAEDEIAAANMVVGAWFAGVRSMTATSGGGFCLMTEALGLAGISETPIVIVDAQRPGPATGLPTRTAQADLQFIIHAAQDEFPRFVFAPGSPEDAYYITGRALHLAEKYQVPALILVDQYLLDSLYIVEDEFIVPKTIERFIDDAGNDGAYKRYVITQNGVSPRCIPCRGTSLVVANGNEHNEAGHSIESIAERITMVNKRNAKLPYMLAEMRPPQIAHGDAQIVLVGWGSTAGAVFETAGLLRKEGVDCGVVHFSDIWPFPGKAAQQALSRASQCFIIENNSTGQFAQLLRQETGIRQFENILKYDGRPFYPSEIAKKVKECVR